MPVGSTKEIGVYNLGALNAAATIDTGDAESIAIAIQTGAFVGTLSYEISMDGTNWAAIAGHDPAVTGSAIGMGQTSAVTGAAMAVRVFQCSVKFFRVRVSAYTSGSISVRGMLRDVPAQFMSSAYIGGSVQIGIVPGMTASSNPGTAPHKIRNAAASASATIVKASAGNVTDIFLVNTQASYRFFRLWNRTTAPTLGTDAPLFTIPLPPNVEVGYCPAIAMRFTAGIVYAITGADATELDTTVLTNAGEVQGFLSFV